MGLGKTIQSIAFLSAIVGEQNDAFSFFRNKKKSVELDSEPKKFKPALVVMPAGVIQQWVREFKKVCRVNVFAVLILISGAVGEWGFTMGRKRTVSFNCD